jgi:hypothetical protein
MMDAIRDMFYHNDRDHKDYANSGEWAHDNSFIKVAHEPLLFLANFDDIYQINILREPVDCISSQVFKSAYGFGGSTIVGRPEIVDGNMEFFRTKKNEFLEESMYQESKMWMGYTYGATKNIAKVIPFTFEQVTQKPAEVLEAIRDIVNSNDPTRLRDREYFDHWLDEIRRHHQNDINFTSGAANGIPTEKPEEFSWVKEAVESYRLMPEMKQAYQVALDTFKARQQELGINIEV